MKPKIEYIAPTWRTSNSFQIIADKGFYIIDPGVYKESYKDCAKIFATHAHFDHIHEVDKWREETGADLYISEIDNKILDDVEANCSTLFRQPRTYKPAEKTFGDGDIIELEEGLYIKVYITPGHTAGSAIFLLFTKAEKPAGDDADAENLSLAEAEKRGVEYQALFMGDTMFHGSIGRTDLPTGSEDDMKKSVARIKKILENLPATLPVLPGHEYLAEVEGFKTNPYFSIYTA